MEPTVVRPKRFVWLLASALAAGTVNATADTPRVLPVLSQDSGRVEALLLLDESSSLGQPRGLDRVLAPNAGPARAPLMRLELGNGSQLGANLAIEAQPGLALLCRGNIGLAAALGSLGDQCLLADVGTTDPLLGATLGRSLGVEAAWQSADNRFDIRFGLAWLESADYAGPGNLAATQTPLAALPGMLPGALLVDTQQLTVSGIHRLGDAGWLRLDGSRTRSFGAGLLPGMPLRWDSTALSLEGGYGTLSGRLTGRLVEVPQLNSADTGSASFDVDFGVSWRTPWQAQFTLGARNLLGQPDASAWPLSTLPPRPDAETRTAYVRYHQDL
jgi:hypothetical protein